MRQCVSHIRDTLEQWSVGYLGNVVIEGESGGIIAGTGEDSQDVLLLARREEVLATVVSVVGAARAEAVHHLEPEHSAFAGRNTAEEAGEAPGVAQGAHRAEVGAAALDGGRLGIDAHANGCFGGGEAPDGIAQALGCTRAAVAEAPGVTRRHFIIFQFNSFDFHVHDNAEQRVLLCL